MYTRERARKVKIHVHAYAPAAEFQSSRFARRRIVVCTASCNCIRARVHARQKSSMSRRTKRRVAGLVKVAGRSGSVVETREKLRISLILSL